MTTQTTGVTRLYGPGAFRLFGSLVVGTLYPDPMSSDTNRRPGVEIHRQATGCCEIGRCGQPADEVIMHPQRGQMAACTIHTRRIRALDASRFPGGAIN